MKKIFKGLSILVASTALCAGIATATACSGGYNGEYIGSYHYTNEYNAVYGMRVKVYVENNIITKIEDITNTDLSVQEATVRIQVGNSWPAEYEKDENGKDKWVTKSNVTWTVVSEAMPSNGWTEDNNKNWTNNEAWLLQQYEGMAVSDVLAIKVFVKGTGEPYEVKDKQNVAELRNPQLKESELLITGATQGSGRLLLAVQDALKK